MNNLTKEERLHSKKLVNKLFVKGSSFFLHPFKVLYTFEDSNQKVPAKIVITVPKRNFRKAVDRNQVKRLVRESYRVHKNELYAHFEKHNKSLIFGLIYVSETILSYEEIERKLILILQRLIEQDEDHIR